MDAGGTHMQGVHELRAHVCQAGFPLHQRDELRRRQGGDFQVAGTLQCLSDVNQLLDLHNEGVQQAKGECSV